MNFVRKARGPLKRNVRVFFVGIGGLAAIWSVTAGASCPDIPLIRHESEPVAEHEAPCESWNPFEHIPLGDSASANLSLGGEVRERYEHTSHPGFGADPEDPHGVWLQRLAVHGDLRLGERWRAFAEIHSALESGRAVEPGPTDENKLALQNAFFEVRLPAASGADTRMRIGIQELQFGSARLISVRDGPNVRRTFYGVRMLVTSGRWTIDAIAARPRADTPGAFDDSPDNSRALWGIYSTRRFGPNDEQGVDAYYLGYRHEDAVFDQGRMNELRHTLGVRSFGSRGPWEWNVEPMVQFGRFGQHDLRAWTVAGEIAYNWGDLPWRPRVMLSANIANGDRDPLDPDLETFNPLFPRGNYFSEDATLGPQNFMNAHVFVTVHPSRSWTLIGDYDAFWRMSTDDAVYGPSGSIVRSSGGSDARFVATALSITSEWTVTRNLGLAAIYTHLAPQAFIRETGPAEPIDFLELTARFRF